MIIYFDTETTGLTPGRIVQLSYVISNGEKTTAKNFFFAVEYVPVQAVQIHGFSAEKLAVLSNGKTFSDRIDEIENDFLSADLIVAHNVNFDIGFMQAEFAYQDRIFKYKQAFDTMKFFAPVCKLERRNHKGYKYPKLSELTEFLDIYSYDISRETMRLYGGSSSFHDARYDTAALYLSAVKGQEINVELKNILNV